jgi:hypothetical protein
MATRGRKTKRTPEVEKIIIDALSIGLSIEDACDYARITTTTFHAWRNQFPDFSDSCKRAETLLIVRSAARLSKEVNNQDGDWKSAIEVLKRRRRNEWSDRTEVTGKDGGDISINVNWGGKTLP